MRATRGVKAAAARRLGCARSTIDYYIRRYPTVHDAFVEARDILVDDAETALGELIDDREWPAVHFTLSTLGKDRGFGDQPGPPPAQESGKPAAADDQAGLVGLAEFEAAILRVYGDDAESGNPEADP